MVRLVKQMIRGANKVLASRDINSLGWGSSLSDDGKEREVVIKFLDHDMVMSSEDAKMLAAKLIMVANQIDLEKEGK
tara:strand:- start:371 stop:601 length:231 start_codon:yes stop_codon:yes gene_type:complete